MHVILDPPKKLIEQLACFVCERKVFSNVQIETSEAEWNSAQDFFPPASWTVVFGGRDFAGPWGRVFIGVCESHKENALLINSMKVVPLSFKEIMNARHKKLSNP